ncbi:hypothetical protein AVEN_111511-1 [Araneus ventricosus]|uniref:SMB domain-containing protein n=1 Tax=Araneus ventricosus TaxID=182803 RepID=A0A4Y2LE53_ARAVE|nr:hypothetical protein AVEN_111511-1 [Araneus ventricosus]
MYRSKRKENRIREWKFLVGVSTSNLLLYVRPTSLVSFIPFLWHHFSRSLFLKITEMETVISSWISFALTVLIVKVLCNPVTSGHPADVTNAELTALSTSCSPTCQEKIPYNRYRSGCDCDSSCSIYGTCCVDSEFRIHNNSLEFKSNLKCLSVYNSPGFEIFMVDSCKNDETFENLCLSNPDKSNDPFLMIPVTSNVTGITYKNYFCAVCNEEVDSEQLQFWDMQIWGNDTLFKTFSEPQFQFNKTREIWTVNDGKNNETSSAVAVTLKIRQNLQATVKYCSTDLIENCPSNWRDEAVALKCRDYMAIVIGFQNVRYKNPHCALCNFENLSNLQCEKFPLIEAPSLADDRDPTRSRDPEDRVLIKSRDPDHRFPTRIRDPEDRVPYRSSYREDRVPTRRRHYEDPGEYRPSHQEDDKDRVPTRSRYPEDRIPTRRTDPEDRVPILSRDHEYHVPTRSRDPENRFPTRIRDPEDSVPYRSSYREDRVPTRRRHYEDSEEYRPRHFVYPEDRIPTRRRHYEDPEEYSHRNRDYPDDRVPARRRYYGSDARNTSTRWYYKGLRVHLSDRPVIDRDIPLINLFVLEDRQKRCGKNMVYDKFASKCRCNSRIYAKENGKCVHKI